MYKRLRDEQGNIDDRVVLRIADGACIPMIADNRDYQDYLAWVAAGNTAEDADAAPTAQELTEFERNAALEQLASDPSPRAKLIRAVLLTALDAINVLRQRITNHGTDIANATSLADLKARWAARPPLDPITVQQMKNAVGSKLGDGAAD